MRFLFVQVSNPVLIDLIRRKVKLNQPYAGIFLKRNDEDDSEVVEKMSDLYEYGSFAQIQEMQDLGDKLRLVVVAHRRIRMTQQLFEDLGTADGAAKQKKKGERRRFCVCSRIEPK